MLELLELLELFTTHLPVRRQVCDRRARIASKWDKRSAAGPLEPAAAHVRPAWQQTSASIRTAPPQPSLAARWPRAAAVLASERTAVDRRQSAAYIFLHSRRDAVGPQPARRAHQYHRRNDKNWRDRDVCSHKTCVCQRAHEPAATLAELALFCCNPEHGLWPLANFEITLHREAAKCTDSACSVPSVRLEPRFSARPFCDCVHLFWCVARVALHAHILKSRALAPLCPHASRTHPLGRSRHPFCETTSPRSRDPLLASLRALVGRAGAPYNPPRREELATTKKAPPA